jgi:Rod binding domain-containing protein
MTSAAGSANLSSLGIAVSGRQLALDSSSGTVDSPEERKLKKAAGDFESILLASMWKSMKQSFGDSDTDQSDPAHGTLEDWGIEVMSSAVGKAGGLGIGKLILKHLEPLVEGQNLPDSTDSAKVLGASADKTGRR